MEPYIVALVGIVAGIFGGFCYGLVNKYGWKEATAWLQHILYGAVAGFLAWLTLQIGDAIPANFYAFVGAMILAGFSGLVVIDAFFGFKPKTTA